MDPKDRGYNAVISVIRERLDDPHASPQSWLAGKLGLTRQAVHKWSEVDGVPLKYMDKVKKLTGLTKDQIRPQDIPLDLPDDIMNEVLGQASVRKETFAARLLAIVRAGINNSK